MEIKLLKKEKGKDIFLVKGVTPQYINTIRRYIVEEVPTMAIDTVKFIENSSAMYDEIIAHRLGLVVLKTDLKSYNLKEECKCKGKGCPRCQTTLVLDKKGPCMVYAEDLKPKDPKIKPVYPKTPIVKLLEGQRLKIEATATLGRGKDHVKFSPAWCYYYGYPKIEIKNCKGSGKCVEYCPKGILKLEKKKVKVTKIVECTLCKACEEACPNGAIKVNPSDKDFIFIIEPWGQLSSKDILNKAIEIFNNHLDQLIKGLKK